jgi:hypothetical protein
VTVSPRIASGSSTIPVTIKYNGLIPSAITFTPSDNGAGGSFSPTTITTDTTENWTGTVTYTPAANKNGTITVANNKGWTVPAALPFSSYVDKFTAIEGEGVAVYRVFEPWQRVYKSYTGPLIQLWKQVGGVEVVQDFGRATGVETLDTAAIATWSAGADGGIIRVAKIYNQSLYGGLTSNTNVTGRQVIEAGWPAVTPSAEYPLYIANRGDGKPTIRWTGTTEHGFHREHAATRQRVRVRSGETDCRLQLLQLAVLQQIHGVPGLSVQR